MSEQLHHSNITVDMLNYRFEYVCHLVSDTTQSYGPWNAAMFDFLSDYQFYQKQAQKCTLSGEIKKIWWTLVVDDVIANLQKYFTDII